MGFRCIGDQHRVVQGRAQECDEIIHICNRISRYDSCGEDDAEHAAHDLCEPDEHHEAEVLSHLVSAFLDEDGEGDRWVEVRAADRPKQVDGREQC